MHIPFGGQKIIINNKKQTILENCFQRVTILMLTYEMKENNRVSLAHSTKHVGFTDFITIYVYKYFIVD